jgi:hypothetical protein
MNEGREFAQETSPTRSCRGPRARGSGVSTVGTVGWEKWIPSLGQQAGRAIIRPDDDGEKGRAEAEIIWAQYQFYLHLPHPVSLLDTWRAICSRSNRLKGRMPRAARWLRFAASWVRGAGQDLPSVEKPAVGNGELG